MSKVVWIAADRADPVGMKFMMKSVIKYGVAPKPIRGVCFLFLAGMLFMSRGVCLSSEMRVQALVM